MHAVPECQTVRLLLDGYIEQTLSQADSERVRQHLADCAECHGVALQTEPSLLFLDLGKQQQTEFFWAGLWRDIQEEIEESAEQDRRSWRVPIRKIFTAAAAFAAISAVGLLYLHRESSLPTQTDLEPATIVATQQDDPSPAALAADLPRATVEDPEARVVTLESSMPIVMVYDPKLDL